MIFNKKTAPLTRFRPVERLVFGGSFDPPHRGHLAMIRYVLERGETDFLDIVPAAVSPFKTRTPPLPGAERLKLIQLALGDIAIDIDAYRDRIRVLDVELNRAGPSFTADTLKQLRGEFREVRIGLLIGSDSFLDIERWTRFRDILFHHTLLVFRRRGDDPERLAAHIRKLKHEYSNAGPEIRLLDNPLVDVASRDVRRAVGDPKTNPTSLLRWLSPSVAAYIQERGLYRAAVGPGGVAGASAGASAR